MMLRRLIILIIVAMVFSSICTVYGDVPVVLNLNTVARGGETVLVIEVRHNSPNPTHYVDLVTVMLGDSSYQIDLDSQNEAVFTVEYVLGSTESVRARAHCTLHSWGQWRQLGLGDANSGGGGIPSFPIESIILAFLMSLTLFRLKKLSQ